MRDAGTTDAHRDDSTTPTIDSIQPQQEYFAVVPKSPLVSTKPFEDELYNDTITSYVTPSDEYLTSIYENYSSLYPSAALINEYNEREYLLQALSAAEHAKQQAELKNTSNIGNVSNDQTKFGFFSRLFGRTEKVHDHKMIMNQKANLLSKIEKQLVYKDIENIDSDNLCGTSISLDATVIPTEAHMTARYHLASSMLMSDESIKPSTARTCNWLDPEINQQNYDESHGSTVSVSPVVVITGLGELIEFQSQKIVYTSDRETLQQRLAELRPTNENIHFRPEYSRSAMIGSNFLLVSWGYTSNRINVTLYRRVKVDATVTDMNPIIAWQAVAYISPSNAVQQIVDDDNIFADEQYNQCNSPLLDITDVVPMVVYDPLEQELPSALVAISRLGGFIELIPLPPDIWYGPEIDNRIIIDANKKKQKKRTKNEKINLPNLTQLLNPNLIVAITTAEYHQDIIGMNVFNTSKESFHNQNLIHEVPSESVADYVIVSFGTKYNNDAILPKEASINEMESLKAMNTHEIVTFWSIKLINDPSQVGIGFRLDIKIAEALDIGSMGPCRTTFATSTIMKHWRKPRRIELAPDSSVGGMFDGREQEYRKHDDYPVTTISVSQPITKIEFIRTSSTEPNRSDSIRAAILDANGGVTVLNCDLLFRTVTKTLTDVDKELLLGDRNSSDLDTAIYEEKGKNSNGVDDIFSTDFVMPLVQIMLDRTSILQYLLKSSKQPLTANFHKIVDRKGSSIIPKILDVNWMHKHIEGQEKLALTLLVANEASRYEAPTLQILLDDFSAVDTRDLLSWNPQLSSTEFWRQYKNASFHRCSNQNKLSLIVQVPPSNMQLCSIEEIHIRDIIQKLFLSKKYADAIHMYETHSTEFSFKDHDFLKKTVEECNKILWETDNNLSRLQSIKDDSYVFNEVISMISVESKQGELHSVIRENNIGLFRLACCEPLKRVSTIRLASSITLGGGEGMQNLVSKVQDCLRKLGTYLILCNIFGTSPCLEHFLRDFLSASVKSLASHFATTSNVVPLSILWYRHKDELYQNFDVLNQIPVLLHPLMYQHLLPIFIHSNDSDSGFMISSPEIDEDFEVINFCEFNSYLKRRYEIDAILDSDDESILNIQCKENASIGGGTTNMIENWYCNRLKYFQQFASSNDHILVFIKLALCGLGVKCIPQSTSILSLGKQAQVMYRSLQIARVLKNMSDDFEGVNFAPSLLPSINLVDFDELSPSDLISLVLDDQMGIQDINVRLDRYLMPLMEQKLQGSTTESELPCLILSYCLKLIGDFSNNHEMNDSDEMYRKFLHALKVCCEICQKSRSSMASSLRLVKNLHDHVTFTLSILEGILGIFKKSSFTIAQKSTALNLIWEMYETLPTEFPLNLHLEVETMQTLVKKMDEIYKELVLLDIISRWPHPKDACAIFEIDDEMMGSSLKSFEMAVGSMCYSFCVQIGKTKYLGKGKENTDLLQKLLSDIASLHAHCFSNIDNSARKGMYVDHLIKPLLKQHQIRLVGEFLSRKQAVYIDHEAISHDVSLFFHDLIYSIGSTQEANDSLLTAIECEESLIKFLPDVTIDFQDIRKYVDAAQYINTVLLAGRVMDPIRPVQLKKQFPIDIIENILSINPGLVILNCKDWSNPGWAKHSNASLRKRVSAKVSYFANKSETGKHEFLPEVPGLAIYHLAKLLGLNDIKSDLTLKSRIVYFAMTESLYGAAAAVSRTLFSDMLEAKRNTGFIFSLIADLVSSPQFDDTATKIELCNYVLCQNIGELTKEQLKSYEQILSVSKNLTNLDQLTNTRAKSPCACIGKFFLDTKVEYNIELSGLFRTLSFQASNCVVDDALLDTIARYSIFWVIARSTRPKQHPVGLNDQYETQYVIVLAVALILFIQRKELAKACFNDVRRIFEDQKTIALQKYSTLDWSNVNREIVKKLIGRGYSEWGARRSAVHSNNEGFDAAVQWAVTHSLDPDFDSPIVGILRRNELHIDSDSIVVLSHAFNLLEKISEHEIQRKAFLESVGMDNISNVIELKSSLHPPVPSYQPKTLATQALPSQSSLSEYGTGEERSSATPLPHNFEDKKDFSEHKLVVLISTNACNRQVTANQERTYTILKARNIEFETLDASDPAYRGLRDQLVSVSGLRGKYPQFFLVELATGEATFWGTWEKLEQANDCGILVQELSPGNVNGTQMDLPGVKSESTANGVASITNIEKVPVVASAPNRDPKKVMQSGEKANCSDKTNHSQNVDTLKGNPSPRNEGGKKDACTSNKPSLQIDCNVHLVTSFSGDVGSPERLALLQAGQKAFEKIRHSSTPNAKDRQRLIEEGRRLLQKQRKTLEKAPISAPVMGTPLRQMLGKTVDAEGTEKSKFDKDQGATNNSAGKVKGKSPAFERSASASNIFEDAWEFDDDDVSI